MEEPVLVREEAVALLWFLADILSEVRVIRGLLEDDGGEEEEGISDEG
jgi:hypothetical protein